MYTFNNFIFGHNLSKNKELNNFVHSTGLEFNKKINDKLFEISCPYHGGRVRDDIFPIIFGTNITDDDQNPNFIKECIEANNKIEEYRADYDQFLKHVKEEFIESKEPNEQEYNAFVDELIKFLNDNDPEFYLLEASS